MAVGGINRYMQIATKAQFPQNAKTDPINNNLPNSSKDGNYPYNPATKQATEPITTSSNGNTSSQPISPSYSHPQGGVARLQAVLANRKYAQQGNNPPQIQSEVSSVSIPQQNNSANLGVADQLGYRRADYQEMIPYLQKQADKDFNRMATYSGIARLGEALGGATNKFSTVFGSFG